VVHLRRLYEAHSGHAAFLFVYITEPPQHTLPEALRRVAGDSAPADPAAKRRRIIREGLRHFGLPFPCLLDTEDKQVEGLYRAFPRRYVLVDAEGRVAMDSGRDPGAPVRWEEIDSWLGEQARPAGHDPDRLRN
jgi:hypothetical protein